MGDDVFRAILFVLVLFVSGCSTGNLTAIHQKTSLLKGPHGTAQGVFIDAEQRVVLSGLRSARYDWRLDPQNNYQWVQVEEPRLVVCAEPSPDALSAIAAQAGLSVSDVSQAISAQGGLSETAANIGLRTQTIQILRDGFYRLCEAQMNGLEDVQYAMMLRRFQTNMIALLAIEQLTGTVKGSDALVSATAGSISFKEAYIQRSAMAATESLRLTGEIDTAKAEIKSLQEVKTACDSASDEDKAKEPCNPESVASRNQKLAELDTRQKSLERQKTEADGVKAMNDELAKAAPSASGAQGGGVLASASTIRTSGEAVSDAVSNIALALINQDYGTQMCLEYLREGLDGAPALKDECTEVLRAYRARIEAGTQRLTGEQERLDAVLDTLLTDGEISDTELTVLKLLYTGCAESCDSEPGKPVIQKSNKEKLQDIVMQRLSNGDIRQQILFSTDADTFVLPLELDDTPE
jgi:DNA-binding transcriptional MerR regulator